LTMWVKIESNVHGQNLLNMDDLLFCLIDTNAEESKCQGCEIPTAGNVKSGNYR